MVHVGAPVDRSIAEVPLIAPGVVDHLRQKGHIGAQGAELEIGDEAVTGVAGPGHEDGRAGAVHAGDDAAAGLLEDADGGEADGVGSGLGVGVEGLWVVGGAAIAEVPDPGGGEAGTGGGVGELHEARPCIGEEAGLQLRAGITGGEVDGLAGGGEAGVLGQGVPGPDLQAGLKDRGARVGVRSCRCPVPGAVAEVPLIAPGVVDHIGGEGDGRADDAGLEIGDEAVARVGQHQQRAGERSDDKGPEGHGRGATSPKTSMAHPAVPGPIPSRSARPVPAAHPAYAAGRVRVPGLRPPHGQGLFAASRTSSVVLAHQAPPRTTSRSLPQSAR